MLRRAALRCSVGALVRLEGLVKGGAAGAFEAHFLEALRGLKDLLLAQALDRRSAVARQAAHAMEVLAAGLGGRFEPLAAPCMLALFKALVITVQVRRRAARLVRAQWCAVGVCTLAVVAFESCWRHAGGSARLLCRAAVVARTRGMAVPC